MEIKQLKALARQRVESAGFDARKLALLFTGAAVALSFAVTLISFLLSRQMESAVGISGIGTRTALSAAQVLAFMVGVVATPFWNLGYTRAALDTVRDGSAEPQTLLEGFRLFFPAIRLYLLRSALFSVIAVVGTQAGAMLYMFTPFSMAAVEMMDKILAGGEVAMTDPAVMEQLLSVFWPMYLLVALVLLVALIPVFYRLRLVEFSLVDGKERALLNMAHSNFRMRYNCLWMFKLDLSFWWYFLLQALAAALAYADQLLGGGDVAYWVFYLLSAGAQLFIGWRFLPTVQASYALAYEEITKEDKRHGQV